MSRVEEEVNKREWNYRITPHSLQIVLVDAVNEQTKTDLLINPRDYRTRKRHLNQTSGAEWCHRALIVLDHPV